MQGEVYFGKALTDEIDDDLGMAQRIRPPCRLDAGAPGECRT
jgi:hypothetical protein